MTAEDKLTTLAHEAGTEDKAGAFMNPPAKRKRGRPKKDGSPSLDAPSQGAGLTSPSSILDSPLNRIENNKKFLSPLMDSIDELLWPLHETPEARLTPEKKMLIVDNGAICMDQYLPGGLNQHMPAIMLCFGLGGYGFGIYNARKIKIAQILENRAKRREAMNGQAPGAPEIAH